MTRRPPSPPTLTPAPTFNRFLTPTTRRAAVGLALAASIFTLGGCKTRALPAVQESGDYNYQRGQYEAALVDYQEFVTRSPGKGEVHAQLGMTYLKLGQTGMAREQLLLANTLRPEDDVIFAEMCETLYQDKKYDDLNRALRSRTVDHGRMQDWALLAMYAEKLGDLDEAQRAWLTAAQVDGGKSVAPQLGLAKLYMSIGDRDRAKKRLAMAYYIDPSNAEVRAAIKQMDEVAGPTFGIPPAESGATATVPTGPTPTGRDGQ